MSKIIRTIAFALVLAGLFTWGMSTLAQPPARVTSDSTAIEVPYRDAGEATPVSLDQIQPKGK